MQVVNSLVMVSATKSTRTDGGIIANTATPNVLENTRDAYSDGAIFNCLSIKCNLTVSPIKAKKIETHKAV